jgi:hypothetical protein
MIWRISTFPCKRRLIINQGGTNRYLFNSYLFIILTLKHRVNEMTKKLTRNLGILFVLFFMLFGCARLPKPDEMKAEVANYQLPKLPEEGKAIVYVIRPSPVGTLIRFNVFLDNEEPQSEMGYTRGSQYIYFNLMPGDHQILSKAENWAEANVSAKPGDIIFLQQDAQMGIVMARNSLSKIQLEDYEKKYQIKHLTLGTIIKTDR